MHSVPWCVIKPRAVKEKTSILAALGSMQRRRQPRGDVQNGCRGSSPWAARSDDPEQKRVGQCNAAYGGAIRTRETCG